MLAALCRPITDVVSAHLGGAVTPAVVAALLVPPTAKGVVADFALPCFQLARSVASQPQAVAADLASALCAAGVTASAAGPYVNCTLPGAAAAAAAGLAQLEQGAVISCVMCSGAGAGRTVCIDFSSPNIAKHLAFVRLLSARWRCRTPPPPQ